MLALTPYDSSVFTISFTDENTDEGLYWILITRLAEYGNKLTAEKFTDEKMPMVHNYTPFKPYADKDCYILAHTAAYSSSNSFLSVLPYYIDYMEAVGQEISSDSSSTKSSSQELDWLISSMVKVKGGTFTMGVTDEGKSSNEAVNTPAHKVILGDFVISKYEVTQALWEAVMGNNPSQFKGSMRPVENVSWTEIQEFITKLNKMTGCVFRLPTEAEWEYAATGGSLRKGYSYSGADDCLAVAWMLGNALDETHPVGLLKPNELGLYDMAGNVSEWCSDWFSSYPNISENNPAGPSTGSKKVYRGGNWLSEKEQYCTSVVRYSASVDSKSGTRGFRLAMTNKPSSFVKPEKTMTAETMTNDEKVKSSSAYSYDKVQIRPKFNDGTIEKFANWVKNMAGEQNYAGDVVVAFTVGVYGNVSNVKIVKGGSNELNKKILNIIKFSPNWTPGKVDGENVPVRCRMTIKF